ncbi:cation diffusion facilitator family transporter [Paenibacillus ferrarius]|uniref:cation diffusion facilitator family transporter n=1 Tax=Paenibacillus ferrarius TaxID=1469647 RepID=UPI003D29E8E6
MSDERLHKIANRLRGGIMIVLGLAAGFQAFSIVLEKQTDIAWLSKTGAVAGLLVALLAIRAGFRYIWRSSQAGPRSERQHDEAADMLEAVQRMHGVITVDELKAREQGHYVVVDMRVSVNPRLSVWEGHEISKRIKHQLMKQYHHVTDVTIHVIPYDAGYPYKPGNETDVGEMPTVIH